MTATESRHHSLRALLGAALVMTLTIGCSADDVAPADDAAVAADASTPDASADDGGQADSGGTPDSDESADTGPATDAQGAADAGGGADDDATADVPDTADPGDAADVPDTADPGDAADVDDDDDVADTAELDDAADVADTADLDDAADVADVADVDDTADTADKADVDNAADSADAADVDPDVWVPPAPGPDDFAMQFDNLTLKTGEEVIMCWYLPPTGKERWVHAVEMEFEYGIHHVRVDRIEDQIGKPAYGPIDCVENTGHAPDEPGWFTTGELPGAQDNHMHMKFPEGTGFRLAPNHGLYFEVHALNTTLKPKDIKGTYKVYTAPKGKISSAVGLLLAFNQKLNYPAKQVSTETASCTFKQPYQLLFATGHMHAYGTLLEAKLNGTTIYQTTDVEDVAIDPYLPPLQILPGDKLTWSCTYDNKLDTPLLIGFSDIYAAMCGFVGFIHPTVDSKSVICDGL